MNILCKRPAAVMNSAQLTALLSLKAGRKPFFAPSYEATRLHRQLVMHGLASCRVERGGEEFISLTNKGRAAL